jgi:hypothetical protein
VSSFSLIRTIEHRSEQAEELGSACTRARFSTVESPWQGPILRFEAAPEGVPDPVSPQLAVVVTPDCPVDAEAAGQGPDTGMKGMQTNARLSTPISKKTSGSAFSELLKVRSGTPKAHLACELPAQLQRQTGTARLFGKCTLSRIPISRNPLGVVGLHWSVGCVTDLRL